jgi:hypothetical protein
MDSCQCPAQAGSATCELQAQSVDGACPTNGKIGKRVDSLTLKAMLRRPLTDLRAVEYRFCREADCPTVYYSEDGRQTFTEADLREGVYQKRPDDHDVFVCYCFRHSVESIAADVIRTGGVTVIEAIKRGIQNGQCACDIRNPQGSCCLGNVNALVKRLKDGPQIQ